MLFVQFLFWIAVWAGTWYAITRFVKSKGRPAWLGHIAGSVFGFVFSLVALVLVFLKDDGTSTAKQAATPVQPAPVQPAPVKTAEEIQQDHDQYLSMEACERAKDAVLDRLKSPSSADFPGCVFGFHKYEIRADKKRVVWFVKGYVDSQNSYGATLRSHWIVKLNRARQGDNDEWTTTKVVIE